MNFRYIPENESVEDILGWNKSMVQQEITSMHVGNSNFLDIGYE